MVGSAGGLDGADGVAWPGDKEAERIANNHQAGLDFKKMCMLLRRTIPASGEIRNAGPEMYRNPAIRSRAA